MNKSFTQSRERESLWLFKEFMENHIVVLYMHGEMKRKKKKERKTLCVSVLECEMSVQRGEAGVWGRDGLTSKNLPAWPWMS